MGEKVRLIDVSKCMGCRGCQVACKNWNRLPAVETEFTGTYENPPDLMPETWSRVRFREHQEGDETRWFFAFYSCLHCEDPACLNVCPVDAIARSSLGAVRINQEECINCGACVTACPFEIPRTNGVAWKCTFCFDRISNNLVTACTKSCPTRAITFGDKEDKISEAEARVQELQDQGFNNAQIYGKEEVGGTNLIYVLCDTPDKYGLPVDPQVSLSTYIWKAALRPVKAMAAVGLAFSFMNNFVEKKAKEKTKESEKEELV